MPFDAHNFRTVFQVRPEISVGNDEILMPPVPDQISGFEGSETEFSGGQKRQFRPFRASGPGTKNTKFQVSEPDGVTP